MDSPNATAAASDGGDLLERLRAALATSLGLAPLLDGARLGDGGSEGGGLLTLTYAHDHARIGQMLERGDKLERVGAALSDVLGRTVLLAVAYDDAPEDATAQSPPGSYVESPPSCPDEPPRPPKPDPREVGLPPKAGEVATDAGKGPVNVDDDPLIKAVIEELGGEVVKVE